MNDKKNVLILAFLTIFLLLPFINKPFNVDDPFYLKMAEHITVDPLKPYSFFINWSGHLRDVWKDVEATFPPLVPYFLALLLKIFGTKEWVMHTCFLVFPVLGVISSYFIAKKFTDKPFIAAMLVLAAPCFYVSSTGIMLDVPLYSFTVFSACLFIYGVDYEKKLYLWFGSIILAMAVLIKYSAVIMFPVILFYIVQKKKYQHIFFFLVPVAVFFLWCLWNLSIYGSVHFLKSTMQVGKGISLHKIIAVSTFFTGVMVFPVFLAMKFAGEKTKMFLAASALCLAASLFLLDKPGEILYFWVLAASTLCFIIEIVRRRKETDSFIGFWFAVSFIFVLFAEPWAAGRYFIVLLLPAAIVFTKLAGKKTVLSGLIATFIIGAAVCSADYSWAKGYKEISNYFGSKKYAGAYFVGHMGFQYYMEQKGFRALEVDGDINKTFIILSKVPDPQVPENKIMFRVSFAEYKETKSVFPLRIMNQGAKAGFYSSFWGIFPFIFSSEPLDKYAVYWVE